MLAAAPQVHADGAELARAGFVDHSWMRATIPGTALTTMIDRGMWPPRKSAGQRRKPQLLIAYPASSCVSEADQEDGLTEVGQKGYACGKEEECREGNGSNSEALTLSKAEENASKKNVGSGSPPKLPRSPDQSEQVLPGNLW